MNNKNFTNAANIFSRALDIVGGFDDKIFLLKRGECFLELQLWECCARDSDQLINLYDSVKDENCDIGNILLLFL
jgi:hypothetical protein